MFDDSSDANKIKKIFVLTQGLQGKYWELQARELNIFSWEVTGEYSKG